MNKQKFTRLLVLCFYFFTGTLFAQNAPADCEVMIMQSVDNQLTISGVTAPNAIIKVFDNDWQLFFECSSECGDTLAFADIPLGDTYHLDAQLYDEDWQLICAKKLDKQIGSDAETCPDEICNSNINLTSQAEVDAFCGCESIDGQLTIGANFNSGLSDITSLANLSQLKNITGSLNIRNNAHLSSLAGLEKVEKVGSLNIFNNPDLGNLDALESLTEMEFGVSLRNCPILSDIDVFERLTFIRSIDIFNIPIKNLMAFANLENSFLLQLSIRECVRLTSLEGLEGLLSIDGSNFNALNITKNPLLRDISALSNLQLVNGNFFIEENGALDDCCGIVQLLDEEDSNGRVVGETRISQNLAGCNSSLDILANCNVEGNASCDDLQISTLENQLIIANMLAPVANIKVYDAAFQLVYDCNGDCPTNIVVPNLNKCEKYSYDIQLFTEQYERICSRTGGLRVKGQANVSSICTGDILLRTQADVDAFCGCDKIEGILEVGGTFNSTTSDITDISNLSSIKEVTNFVRFQNTPLRSISNLNFERLENGWLIQNNPNLESVVGPNNLVLGDFLQISFNNALTNISGFNATTELTRISFQNNQNLRSIAGFSELTTLNSLNISGNRSLPEIVNFRALISTIGFVQFTNNNALQRIVLPNWTTASSVFITRNNNLSNITVGENLNISRSLQVSQNFNLSDCCTLRNLIDGDLENGEAIGDVTIEENAVGCNIVSNILANCEEPMPTGCETIIIESNKTFIDFNNLTAPNVILKVFDSSYEIVYNCAGDCEEFVSVNGLSPGVYYTDVQFYDENWQFICDDKREFTIEEPENPCGTNICNGPLVAYTQSQIDQLCSCGELNGNLTIGARSIQDGMAVPPVDITNLNGLSGLKKINGSLAIVLTDLKNLQGLDNLTEVKSINIIGNNQLEDLSAFKQIKKLNNLSLRGNTSIKNFNDLEGLEQVRSIVLEGNRLNDLTFFSQVDKDSLQSISIISCDELMSLDGLEGIKDLNSVLIASNDQLVDIQALKTVESTNNLILGNNAQLSDCCAITHLIDDNPDNGVVNEAINILDNPAFCSSVEEILASCTNPPTNLCEEVIISTDENFRSLKIANLSAPIEIVKVFDSNWQKIYECFADCSETIELTELTDDRYYVQIAMYDADWTPICDINETVEFSTASQNRNNDLLPTDFAIVPNPASEQVQIQFAQPIEESGHISIYNTLGKEVSYQSFEKIDNRRMSIDLSNWTNGVYFVQIKTKNRRVTNKKLIVNRLY